LFPSHDREGDDKKNTGIKDTPHLQFYIMLKKKKSLSTIRNPEGMFRSWHIESCRGSPHSNHVYCKKEGMWWFESGDLPGNGGEDSRRVHSEIISLARQGRLEEIAEQYPAIYLSRLRAINQVRVEAMNPCFNNGIKCFWIFGKPRQGKSSFAFNSFDINDIYPKNPNKWWDNFKGQRVVIVDDWSLCHHVLGYHLKRWADKFPILSETKGGSLYPSYDRVIITSNYRISQCFNDPAEIEAIEGRFEEIEYFHWDDDGYHLTDKGRITKAYIE
jgi:hypothetical protein